VSISKKIMNYLGKTSLDVTEYLKHYRGSQRGRVDKNY